MSGLIGLINSDKLTRKKALSLFDVSLCDSWGSKQKWQYHDKDTNSFIGWRGREMQKVSDYCLESEDIVVCFDGWLSSTISQESPAAQIAELYRNYQQDFLRYISGHFFIALWIKEDKSLLLASDSFGLRPHYWCKRNKTLSFAYEVGALIAVNDLDEKLDLTALAQFMSYEFLLQDRTWHPDIKLVPSGTYLLVTESGELRVNQYWSWQKLKELSDNKRKREIKALETARAAFNSAVKKCYSHAQNGVVIPLSGGLDTRALISAADISHTLTLTHGLPGCANRIIAKKIAGCVGVNHLEYDINPEWLPLRAEHIVWLTSGHESLRHTHSHSYYHCFDEFRDKIVIGGVGGEYVRAFFYDFGFFTKSLKIALDTTFPLQSEFLAKILYWRMKFGSLLNQEAAKFFQPEIYDKIRGRDYKTLKGVITRLSGHGNIYDQMDRLYLEQRVRRFIINGQLHTWDHVELRWPFMDIDFILAARKIHHKWKFGSRFHRYLIARNLPKLMDILHDETLKPLTLRPNPMHYLFKRLPLFGSQSNFTPYTDYSEWFRINWREWIETLLLSNSSLCHEYFKTNQIKKLWQDHLNGQNKKRILSCLITLELWLKLQKRFCNMKNKPI